MRTSLSFDVGGDLGQQEELIGDTLWNAGNFTVSTQLGLRARYLILLTQGAARDSMFYMDALQHRWGWYTSKEADNCGTGGRMEKHDTNGDTFADSMVYGDTVFEHHCLPNGQFTLRMEHVTWNTRGDSIVAGSVVFRRKVALLDALGSYVNDPASPTFHDVRVTLDLADRSASFAWSGDVRAGDHYLPPGDSLYPQGTAFTIAAGDTMWFQSTYVGTGNDARLWYGSRRAILTQFNFDHVGHPSTFQGGINSSPDGEVSPALGQFPATGTYQVMGRVVAPHDDSMEVGEVELGASIYVTTVVLDACFSVTGYRVAGQTLTLDGHCSSGADVLEYRWSFGDGGVVEWPADSVVVHHAYAGVGSYPATLWVRRAGTAAPMDSTTQALSITGPLWVHLNGYDHIATSGNCTWTSQPHDGAPPYRPYAWYYQEGSAGETLVGTAATYRRYVTVKPSPYAFRLRNTVRDAIPTAAEDTLWVDVSQDGDG